VYKVRTGRTGLVAKLVSLVPERDCERNAVFNPSEKYRNTLVLIVTQYIEAGGG